MWNSFLVYWIYIKIQFFLQVLLLLGAISSHKLVVGFCLGLELAANTTSWRHVIGILVFSAGSVAGIIAGGFLSNIQNLLSDELIAVLQVGTF